MIKKDFRKYMIGIRKNKDSEFIDNNSLIISDKFLSLDFIDNAKNIMLYLDFNNEVKTGYLINKLLSFKKSISSPVTIINDKKLIPYEINSQDDFKIGAYGIKEPNTSYCTKVNVSDIDIVIVPAVAYDKNCYRLGYGGGYYDRFLSSLKEDTIFIGLAFDFQICDIIPKEEHDIQLDYVITESQILSSYK